MTHTFQRSAKWQRHFQRLRKKTHVVHINDCADENARLRLTARSTELLGPTISFAGVRNDLEASGQLIDALAALHGATNTLKRKHQNVLLVNIAPRNGEAKQYENGTPFCYFRFQGTLVVATLDGYTLSLVKKFGITNMVRVLETPKAVAELCATGLIAEDEQKEITNTQFRSYEFSPRVATYLLKKSELVGTNVPITDITDAPRAVWFIDNFGNCKTTVTKNDLALDSDNTLTIANQPLPFYDRLRDVPDNELAVVSGSSGFAGNRFLEIVQQGGSAARQLQLGVGTEI